MLRVYPSISAQTVRHFLSTAEGVVLQVGGAVLQCLAVLLQCYGAGNIPSSRQDILDAIREHTHIMLVQK